MRKQREEAERKLNEVKRQWEEMKRKAGKLGLHGESETFAAKKG